MMKRQWLVTVFLGLVCGLGAAPTVLANGMAFVDRSAATGTGEFAAVPTGQRAALVRDGLSWSLILEPRYERPDAGAAWLVPFAHCPTVSAADPALLAELGLVTAPLFLELCIKDCRCGDDGGGGCLGPFAGDSGAVGSREDAAAAQGEGDTLHVDVWQTGTIGNLDFVVISAEDPADIPAWLDLEGYESPQEMADFVTDHATEYGCYFAAKVGAPAGSLDAFPSVRFDLDPRDPPTYPLKLTGLGVAKGQALDLTLFVVNPADRFEDGSSTIVTPANFDARPSLCTGKTAQEFQTCLDRELVATPAALTVTFHDRLDSRNAVMLEGAICDFRHQQEDFWSPGWCLATPSIFPGIPESWTPEVDGWMATRARVTRFEARMPPKMLETDLIFHMAPGTPAETCTWDSECYADATWEWDGGICAPAGTAGACARRCYDQTECPTGWTCAELFPGQGYYQMFCAPPRAAAAGLVSAFQDPLPRLDGLHVAYTTDCDLDCDDICDGTVSGGAVVFGPPRSARQVLATVPVLAIVLASQLVLVAARRRRRRGLSPQDRPDF